MRSVRVSSFYMKRQISTDNTDEKKVSELQLAHFLVPTDE